MKKKLIGIFVVFLFIGTAVLPVSGTIKNNENNPPEIMDESNELTTQPDLETSDCMSTVTVFPTDDSYVEDTSSIPYGTKTYFRVGDNQHTPPNRCRGYLKFDLNGAGIPAGATITQATLYLLNEGIGYDIDVGAHYLNYDTWDETTVVWSTPHIDNFDPIPTDVETVTQTNYWYTWDITPDVQEAVDTDFILSEVLKATVENQYMETCVFLSKEYGGYDPYIVIDYCSLGDVWIEIPPGPYLGANFPVTLFYSGGPLLHGVDWRIDWTTVFSFPPGYPSGFTDGVNNLPDIPYSTTVYSGPLPPAGIFGLVFLNIVVTADCATDVTTNAILFYFGAFIIIRVF